MSFGKRIIMRTSCGATLCKITELMNMESVIAFGKALESSRDLCLGVEVGLFKMDDT